MILLLLISITTDWVWLLIFTRFLDHTQRHTTVGRTPLNEWSARHRDLNLTTHNIHNRQTSMLPVGFEPTTPAGKWPQTYALDRAGHWDRHCLHYVLRPYPVICKHICHFLFVQKGTKNNSFKFYRLQIKLNYNLKLTRQF